MADLFVFDKERSTINPYKILKVEKPGSLVITFAYMRRFIFLLVSICYVASSSGVGVEWHYCMGKLRSVGFGTPFHQDACSKCGMQKKANNCCKDDVSFSKVTDAHQQAGILAYNPLKILLFSPAPIPGIVPLTSPEFVFQASGVSPPPLRKVSRNNLFCIYRC